MTKTPDEIMADYLLTGAKMLSELCPKCGAPLFEIKGDKRCVVCEENNKHKAPEKVPENIRVIVPEYAKDRETKTPLVSDSITQELNALILDLCCRAKNEKNAGECLKIIECIRTAAEAKTILSR